MCRKPGSTRQHWTLDRDHQLRMLKPQQVTRLQSASSYHICSEPRHSAHHSHAYIYLPAGTSVLDLNTQLFTFTPYRICRIPDTRLRTSNLYPNRSLAYEVLLRSSRSSLWRCGSAFCQRCQEQWCYLEGL